MDRNLHIICLDIPYPVDYGGVFDLFYKIRALHEAGIKIHLHCFEYGRMQQEELNKYCANVFYYQRIKGIKAFSFGLPYIVNSRKNQGLLKNLLSNDYPILLEGIHCSYILNDNRFKERKMILRLHNVEYAYYRQLFKSTTSFYKKIYYAWESKLLFRYERSIARKVLIAAVSEQDAIIYQKQFKADKIFYLPVFLPYKQLSALPGMGCYCLYHGNLSVPENEKAALWLLENVFSDLEASFVIAGKNPSGYLKNSAAKRQNTCLVANPSQEEMQDLIAKAQINILPSFNATGIKLKLLNALFNGRHCVVNEAAVTGTGLSETCHVGATHADLKSIVTRLYQQPFSEEDLQLRRSLLEGRFENSKNVQTLIQWIW